MKKITGVTLIEVLIALAIGIGLTFATTKIFIQSKKNYQIQLATSEIINSANYANYVLEKFIRVAGYRQLPNNNDTYTDFDTLFPCGVIGGDNQGEIESCKEVIASDNGENGLAQDSLLIYFQAENGLSQCDNTSLPASAINDRDILLYRFTVINKQLRCLTYNVSKETEIGSDVVLLDHVVSFQVLYGLGNDNKQIERYVPISFPSLETPVERNRILAIRIGLLLESSQNNISRQSSAPEFINILDTKRNYPDENRLYFLMTNTIQLRNNFDVLE